LDLWPEYEIAPHPGATSAPPSWNARRGVP
jgi:hypothetical protein